MLFLMNQVRQNGRNECLPFRILAELGALLRAMGKIVVGPQEDDRVQNTRFFGPAADELGIARNDAQPGLLINLQKFGRLARLQLIRPHLVDH